tara:strand:- start:4003 stop:5181 length:1179 start_codon:yes stop_codon:yes gene_type:complete
MGNSLKVGIIGDTGRGNYGHGLDLAYEGLDQFDVVAVSDPDPVGLNDAVNRIGVSRYYKDYREMLDKEQLDVVSVCPRWVGKHREMIIAAAESGAKAIFCEKPIAATLAHGDEIMDLCNRKGVRVAVAHRRANMYEEYGKQIIERGDLGDILSIKARGKEDHRSGATDLMVLGTHLMDSMRYMAGSEVQWVYGRVTQDENEISMVDVREGDEEIGLIAGNGVDAFYSFNNGISGYFESHPQSADITTATDTKLTRSSRSFGFEVYGTEGIISIRCSPCSEFYQYPHGRWIPDGIDGNWERVIIDDWDIRPDGSLYTANERTDMSNKIIAREIHAAILNDRDIENVSSGSDAVADLEMIMGIHQSQITRSRVYFPMENRDNPYETWLNSESIK